MTQPIDPTPSVPEVPAPVPAASPADSQANDLAGTIQSMIDQALAGAQRAVKGVITATAPTASPPVVSLTLSGDTVVVGNVRYIDSYSPVVGDTVLVEKQGSDIFVLGQMNNASSGAANGWASLPTLGAGFTAATQTPQFRQIVDNGDQKMQLRGRINISGSPTAICTMVAANSPSLLRSVSAATDSAPANISFNTNGTVTLDATTGGGAITGTSASTTPGSTGTAGSHSHATAGPTDSVSHSHGGDTTLTTINHNINLASNTELAHSHTGAAHSHTAGTFASPAITAPTWVSLDGIEFFL